jgi:hypothetical protein
MITLVPIYLSPAIIYDVAQVCLNGHVANGFARHQDFPSWMSGVRSRAPLFHQHSEVGMRTLMFGAGQHGADILNA